MSAERRTSLPEDASEQGYPPPEQPRDGWTTLGGDCPLLREFLEDKEGLRWTAFKFFVAFARGFSQAAFANNPITGIILMIAVASIAPGTFIVCSVTGLLGQLISMSLKEPAFNVENGLTVFNPLIFGAVSYYFVPIVYGVFDGFSILMMLLGVIFIAYFWRACGNGYIPCLTMPFNLAELILLFTLKNAQSHLGVPTSQALLALPLLSADNGTTVSTPITAGVEASEGIVGDDLDWGMVVRASVVSASQLFLRDSVPLGAIIYLSLLIYSPMTCLFAYMGSLISSLVGLQVGATHESVYAGLWGFNGYLTGASLGGSFLVMNGQVAVATIVAVVCTGCLQHVLQAIFLPSSLPAGYTGTIPFVLATWLFIGLGRSADGSFSYPVTMSYPEAQRQELRSRNKSIRSAKIKESCEPELLLPDGKESVVVINS